MHFTRLEECYITETSCQSHFHWLVNNKGNNSHKRTPFVCFVASLFSFYLNEIDILWLNIRLRNGFIKQGLCADVWWYSFSIKMSLWVKMGQLCAGFCASAHSWKRLHVKLCGDPYGKASHRWLRDWARVKTEGVEAAAWIFMMCHISRSTDGVSWWRSLNSHTS